MSWLCDLCRQPSDMKSRISFDLLWTTCWPKAKQNAANLLTMSRKKRCRKLADMETKTQHWHEVANFTCKPALCGLSNICPQRFVSTAISRHWSSRFVLQDAYPHAGVVSTLIAVHATWPSTLVSGHMAHAAIWCMMQALMQAFAAIWSFAPYFLLWLPWHGGSIY